MALNKSRKAHQFEKLEVESMIFNFPASGRGSASVGCETCENSGGASAPQQTNLQRRGILSF